MFPIFDIARNSFEDGPGIRTTVFFRGCNLSCAWCHNPESRDGKRHIFHYKDRCMHCGKCTSVCPNGAVRCGKLQPEKCVFCGQCETVCPSGALSVCGKDYTETELLSLLLRDADYYAVSGGGVTFSGGECMLWAKEIAPFSASLATNGIHTAIDTAGNVPWEAFKLVLPYTDLFLYDIKTLDREKHIAYTGVSNERILKNLESLFSCGASVWIRIPVIGGVNDTEEDMRAIREFLSPYRPEKIELLPYHRLGEPKYAALGLLIPQFPEIPEEKMKALRAVFS